MQAEEIELRFKAIDAVIAELHEDYKPLAFFLRLSGARIERALTLTVADIENAFGDGYTIDHHSKFLVKQLDGALSASAVNYLLRYVVTTRKAALERLSVGTTKGPQDVFIDKNGRPLESAKVFTAFRMASAKCGQDPLIGPRDIRQAIVGAYAAAMGDRHLFVVLAESEAGSGAFAVKS
ncbi:hypothetical protein [Rhizobium leguminosarum]|uniref:hypothetical protein n=1 Tax=Rhizobium leguminosarum TaxID=384 RepID=UPI003F95C50C